MRTANVLKTLQIFIFFFLIAEKPRFSRRLPLETQGEFGKALTLPCPIRGSTPLNITWLRNGVPLAETPTGLRFSQGSRQIPAELADEAGVADSDFSLVVSYMRLEDSGMFQCVAENAAGSATASTWLRVKSELFIYFS